MEREDRNSKSKVYKSFKGSLHIAMGGIYIVVGCSMIILKALITMPLSTPVAYMGGGLFLLYGAFRVWRGVMDMRNRY